MTLSVALRMLAIGAFTLAPPGGHAFSSVSIETEIYERAEDAQPTPLPAAARARGSYWSVHSGCTRPR